ncbi:MAG: RdgB/HAM1 family non-canonical purine NTP pyrophosphatase [Mariniblastus sp.]|nr:RdgB/HAM1 family non-canonical purine NTP pyrophosphatase [Mariniblastus sp.]
MSQHLTLVLGTHNQKKRLELSHLLAPYPVEIKSLEDYPAAIDVEETGDSFAANAILKATEQAQQLQQWVLGEDSGLSVAALDGAPGIYSARFSGPGATDATNNELLLERLQEVPSGKRSAWYTCNMALSDPRGTVVIQTEAYCHGQILSEPRGSAGFGYDPLFEIPEYSLTFAEMGNTVKSILSHRARAHRLFMRPFLQLLCEMVDKSTED